MVWYELFYFVLGWCLMHLILHVNGMFACFGICFQVRFLYDELLQSGAYSISLLYWQLSSIANNIMEMGWYFECLCLHCFIHFKLHCYCVAVLLVACYHWMIRPCLVRVVWYRSTLVVRYFGFVWGLSSATYHWLRNISHNLLNAEYLT